MTKIEKSVNVLVNNVLENISVKHDIELSCLQETVSPLFVKPNFERCEGLVASKNNLPLCRSKVVCGTKFCRRHAPLPDDQFNVARVIKQCNAIVNNGSRCLKHAKPNHDICGIHITKQIYVSRSVQNNDERVNCVYYEDGENDDENYEVTFCTHRVVNKDGWFCKKHNHLQSMYERMYVSKNLKDYITNNKKTVQIIENFIETNSYSREQQH